MKKIFPYLIAIILTVILFTGCKPLTPSEYDQFDYGDSVTISWNETLYENENIWVRLDSVTENYTYYDSLLEMERNHIVVYLSVYTYWRERQLVLVTDSCTSHSFTYTESAISSYAEPLRIILVDVTPKRVLTEPIIIDDYRVEFILYQNTSVDRKPNLYLYPEEKTKMSVSMDFPHGGKVIESDPAYPAKWENIKVKPDGTINNKYDYLFYECEIPDFWQYVDGWVIKQEDLPGFFEQNLAAYGFNEKEIKDFIDFWIPELKDDPYYMILPQYTEMVNQVIKLWITPRPDKLMRLHYVISGSAFDFELPEPEIPAFKREGFTAVEWGVILK
jgi:hypothetical protein